MQNFLFNCIDVEKTESQRKRSGGDIQKTFDSLLVIRTGAKLEREG